MDENSLATCEWLIVNQTNQERKHAYIIFFVQVAVVPAMHVGETCSCSDLKDTIMYL